MLKTNDFDANLNKSKKNVNGFQSDIAKMSGVAVSGVMKFAGVLGIAVTASEGFNKVMNSSQTLGDEYARTMDGLKGGVDQFFTLSVVETGHVHERIIRNYTASAGSIQRDGSIRKY